MLFIVHNEANIDKCTRNCITLVILIKLNKNEKHRQFFFK